MPCVAAGQSSISPSTTTAGPAIDITPRTPPPPTIPTAPEVLLPLPPLPTNRPVKTFDFRPMLSVSEEYSDNFNRSSRDPISNFRSMISPGFQLLLDSGFLTGQAMYTLSAFRDSSVDEFGKHHLFVGQLAWQVTPRLKLSLADTFTQSDNPALADRLDLRLARQEFTSNLLSLVGDYSLGGRIDTSEYYRLSTFTSAQQTTSTHTLGAKGSVPLGQIHTLTLGYEYLDSETTVERAGAGVVGAFGNSATTGHQLTGSFSRDLTKERTAGVTAAYAIREQTVASGRTNFSRWSVSLFNNYVAEKLVLRGSIGLAQLDAQGAKARLLFTSDTDVAYHLGPAVLGLRLERGFSESFGQGQNFGVVETSGISGSLFYRFSPLLTASATGGYRENKFTGLGGGLAGGEDQVITVTANLSYQVLRWLTATVDYTYTHAKLSGQPLGFVEDRFRAALNALIY
jgi:hypothetical protein